MSDFDDIRRRFDRIVAAPRGSGGAAAEPLPGAVSSPGMHAFTLHPIGWRPFSAYVNDDVASAAAISARLSEIVRRLGGGAIGLDAALAEAERLLASETIGGMVQYALKLFVVRDATARRHLRLAALERRQPGAVRAVGEPREPCDDETKE